MIQVYLKSVIYYNTANKFGFLLDLHYLCTRQQQVQLTGWHTDASGQLTLTNATSL